MGEVFFLRRRLNMNETVYNFLFQLWSILQRSLCSWHHFRYGSAPLFIFYWWKPISVFVSLKFETTFVAIKFNKYKIVFFSGNTGKVLNLTGDVNTYFSKDGGVSWEQGSQIKMQLSYSLLLRHVSKYTHQNPCLNAVREQRWAYEIGDHGGLLVLAPVCVRECVFVFVCVCGLFVLAKVSVLFLFSLTVCCLFVFCAFSVILMQITCSIHGTKASIGCQWVIFCSYCFFLFSSLLIVGCLFILLVFSFVVQFYWSSIDDWEYHHANDVSFRFVDKQSFLYIKKKQNRNKNIDF